MYESIFHVKINSITNTKCCIPQSILISCGDWAIVNLRMCEIKACDIPCKTWDTIKTLYTMCQKMVFTYKNYDKIYCCK